MVVETGVNSKQIADEREKARAEVARVEAAFERAGVV